MDMTKIAKDIRVSVGKEIAGWKRVHRPTLHAAQPILDRIDRTVRGVQTEPCQLSIDVLPDHEFQLLVADSTINLLEAVDAEAHVKLYYELCSRTVAEEAPRIAKLQSQLHNMRDRLDARLSKILVRHYYAG